MDHVRYVRFPPDSSRIAFAPVLLAIDRGYFEDEGLATDLVMPERNSWITLAEGGADVGACHVAFCGDPRFVGRIKAVMVHERHRPGWGFTQLLARPELVERGRVTSDPACLAGLRIGLLPGRGDDYLAWHGVLSQAGLTIDDVEAIPVPHDGPQRTALIQTAQVDVVIGRGPRHVDAELRSGLLARWKQGNDVSPDAQAQYITASADFMVRRSEVGVRWIRAYLRAVGDYRRAYDHGEDRQRMVDDLSRLTGETEQLLTTMAPAGFDPDAAIDFDRLRTDLGVLAARGLVEPGVEAHDVADRRLVDAALTGTPRGSELPLG